MDTLYLLLPMSVLLVLALIGLFAWAINAGQFEDLEREGWRIVQERSDDVHNVEDAPQSAPDERAASADSSPKR